MKHRVHTIVLILLLAAEPLFFLSFPVVAEAGSQTFTSNGTFTVPSYATLTVTMWGAGGGGGGGENTSTAGTASTFSGLTAGGGARGIWGGAGGSGGSASGGDTNTSGNAGNSAGSGGAGGSAPGGGGSGGSQVSGNSDGNPGNAPGGGGSGVSDIGEGQQYGGGGGSGGYVQKTYTVGDLTPGAQISVTIGTGGHGGVNAGYYYGGAGARGEVQITWTDLSPPTLTTSAPSSVTASTATLNGNITATGGANATVRGFATSTSSTLSSNVSTSTESGSFGTGAFTGASTNHTGNTTYYFRAYATNPGGTGYGSIQSFLTLPGTPGTPSYASTNATSTGVTWSAPSGGAASYKLNQCSGGTCSLFTGISSNSTTTHSLTGNTTYDYAVRGTNTTGDGTWSATSSILTAPGIPGTPTFSDITQTTLRVSWSSPTGGVSSYKLERCTGSGCTDFAQIATGETNAYFDDSGRTANTTYRYRVRGTNATGDGLYSSGAEVTTAADSSGEGRKLRLRGVRLRGVRIGG